MLPDDMTPETLEDQTPPVAEAPHIEPLMEVEEVTESEAPETPAEQPAAETEAPNDWQDRFVRLAAEYDNFRKRTQREKEALITSTAEQLILALLPTLDDLERALKAAETSENLEKLKEGVSLAHKKFHGALSRQGLEPIEAAGEGFDPELHESIASLPVEDETKKGKVIDEVERGYRLRGKVIRFAKVAVGE